MSKTKNLKIREWGPALRFYWQYTAPVMGKIWYIWPVWLILILSQLVEPYVYQNVFDEVGKIGQPVGLDLQKVIWFVAGWAVILLVSSVLMTGVRMLFSMSMPNVDRNYFEEAMQKVLALDMSFHLEKKSGEMMKKIDRGVDSFWTITMIMIPQMIPKLLLAVVVLVWAISINWQMTLVSMAFYPLAIWVFIIGVKKTGKLQDESNDLFDKAMGRAYDAVSNIVVVKSFAQEKKEQMSFLGKFKRYVDLQKLASIRWGRVDIWGQSSFTMQKILIIAFGIYLIIQGQLTLGQLVMFTAFSGYLYEPITAIGGDLRGLQYAVLRLEEARKILERIATVQDIPGAKNLKVTQGRVQMKNVGFMYQDKKILSNASIDFEPGQMTALVGHSGAGKSTITSLLNRFYDVQSGQILIDGQDITKVTQSSLRRNIGLVMQENTLFNDTIYNNIAYAKPGATRWEIYQAARKANIHKFIMSLPKSYKTMVGERGLKLSGGEKQRVAIARVILKDPPILILDEATSALDSKNERIIQMALERVMKGRTSIVIAHRLSTVTDADKIVVMNRGKVVQIGKHSELKNTPGVYQELVNLQVRGLLAK
jgi:ATP-binding cassette subfamily B protein